MQEIFGSEGDLKGSNITKGRNSIKAFWGKVGRAPRRIIILLYRAGFADKYVTHVFYSRQRGTANIGHVIRFTRP